MCCANRGRRILRIVTRNSTIVRHAVTGDAEAISAIGSQAFSAAYAKFNDAGDISTHLRDHYSPAAIRQEMGLQDRFYLLALVDEEPAGLCKMCQGATPEGIPEPASLEIQQLYIHPAHQRRGIGKALVDAARLEARSANLSGVWLGVWEKAILAIDFYSNYGFTKCGSHTFMLASSQQTDLLMWISVRTPDD